MWGWESMSIIAILTIPSTCRVYIPSGVDEEVKSQQQSEYNYRQWETDPELANDLDYTALDSDKRGLILDDYSQQSVAIIGDKSVSEKLPVVSQIQLKPETDHKDHQKNLDDGSDNVCGDQQQELEITHFTNIIDARQHRDGVINNDSQVISFSNETNHLNKIVWSNSDEEKRNSRIFSIFSLVRFKNEACTPSGTKNTYMGTCYLATECAERVSAE